MKKIFKHIGACLAVVLMGAVTACNIQEISDPGDVGLGIKVFFPTKVVAGQPMTINGSGFSDAKEIVFPDGVSVTDFEIVSNDMIRVKAPSGISAAGGKIKIVTSEDEAESCLDVTVGKTVISGYSKQAGESVQGGEQITIYGEDLEFINAIELLDVDGNPNLISDMDFYRKGTSSVIFYVPRENIFTGTFAGKVFTYDGQQFTMPELAYEPAPQQGGHWETVKTMIWENDGSVGPALWSGSPYRFCVEGRESGEQVAAIPADLWEKMKTEPFRITIRPEADWYQVRIIDAWWSMAIGGGSATDGHNDISTGSELLIPNEDGTFYIEINLKDDPLASVIDEKHLFFGGDGYTILAIYTQEEVWIEGEEGHWERTSYWKNDGSVGPALWSGSPYRFCVEGRESGEQVAAIPADLWEKMKTEPFRITIRPEADWYQVRIIDAWWSMAIGGGSATDGHNDISTGSELLIPNEDGTFYIEINLKDDPLASVIDEKHLFFGGDGYTILEIYSEVWVEGGGGDADPEIDLKDHITYEQPDPAFSYPYYPSWGDNTGKLRILRDRGLKELGLQAGKSKFIFYKTAATTGQIQINNPNWSTLTTVADWNGDVEILEYVLDEDAIKCITGETADGWSETAIILQGDGLEVTKITVLP